MSRAFVAVAVLLAGIASAWAEVRFTGGDGASREAAVVIEGVAGSFDGIRAEGEWVRQNHPGWRKRQQALIQGDNGRLFDRIGYDTPDGAKELWFDITGFFGK